MFAEKIELILEHLWAETANFTAVESMYDEPALFGVTDGKAVSTYFEHKFTFHLMERYRFGAGNSANGIDLLSLNVDIKVTSIRQPQSSCPDKSALQKIYGLGYHLIVFVYEKTDDPDARTGRLNMLHTIFVDKHRTADFQMTRGLRQIIENDGNADDIVAFIQDKNLPVDEIEARNIVEAVLHEPPLQGYLTISNALQWRARLSHRRAPWTAWNGCADDGRRKEQNVLQFGDFQTSLDLARDVCAVLTRRGISPGAIVEPTCGQGAFLQAAAEHFTAARHMLGVEINAAHVMDARLRLKNAARVEQDDFFSVDWDALLASDPGP
ncbi:putative type II restriction enzyme [Sodalis glossinidius str. 'morsitans']|uniref:Type II restriction enzyme n=1 Tax=Sodalis glossinidius (strain morsitans) TaxID=343509 RepID=Q2NR30_SODGM